LKVEEKVASIEIKYQKNMNDISEESYANDKKIDFIVDLRLNKFITEIEKYSKPLNLQRVFNQQSITDFRKTFLGNFGSYIEPIKASILIRFYQSYFKIQ
jgi:hypothetical protein